MLCHDKAVLKKIQKTFILGVGAQKSGTSWLYQYLRQNKHFDGGSLKEYHMWNYLDDHEERSRIDNTNYLNYLTKPGLIYRNFFQKKMRRSESFYFDYFESLLDEDIRITADITPAYCILDADRMTHIRSNFAKRNILVKSIFIIRDPVDRVISSARMVYKRKKISEAFNDFLQVFYRSTFCQKRTHYYETILSMRSAFPEDHLIVEPYESLFTAPSISKVSDFLDVTYRSEFIQKKVFEGSYRPEVDSEIRGDIRDFYSDVYSFCFDSFPETQKLWT